MRSDEEVVYNFCTELLTTSQVSDATFGALKNAFGERGVVDVIAVTGWYNTVSMLLPMVSTTNVPVSWASNRSQREAPPMTPP